MFTASKLACTVLTAASLALWPLAATAAPSGGGSSGGSGGGGGGGSTSNTPTMSPKKLKCKKGQVVRSVTVNGTKKKKCVRATAGVIPDAEMFAQGNALALDGDYDWALDVLELADQSDPRVLNMQGYSHRKAGRLDVAVGYYSRALDLNPDFVRAREYLGEGYAAAGRIDLARQQLAEIEKRCGTTCSEYQDLSKAISAAGN